MMPLDTFFILMLVLFAIIGGMRGWVKELLVTFSVFLGYFIEYIIRYVLPRLDLFADVPFAQAAAEPGAGIEGNVSWFYIRTLLLVVIVGFGYATTTISAKLGGQARKEKFQDTLLGVFLGLINGYLIVGSLWGFLQQLGYGQEILGITTPAEEVMNFVNTYLPTAWLTDQWVFVLVAVSFTFILIVFV